MGSNLMLEDLAHAVNMSKFHFSRRFREESGKSPMQFTSEMRIQAAKRMLQQTDMTISAIAAAVGLRDAAHFSHVFKRHTGYSPGAFRSAR
jgi:AraC family transcriptional regulator